MNPAMINAVADQHIRELRHHAARRRAAARHREPRPAGAASRPPRLRSHLGFALVEAGFYLLASARLASRD
jgi:hypothetical protein